MPITVHRMRFDEPESHTTTSGEAAVALLLDADPDEIVAISVLRPDGTTQHLARIASVSSDLDSGECHGATLHLGYDDGEVIELAHADTNRDTVLVQVVTTPRGPITPAESRRLMAAPKNTMSVADALRSIERGVGNPKAMRNSALIHAFDTAKRALATQDRLETDALAGVRPTRRSAQELDAEVLGACTIGLAADQAHWETTSRTVPDVGALRELVEQMEEPAIGALQHIATTVAAELVGRDLVS